jgi:GNAT superfamily N-acetyltransferase
MATTYISNMQLRPGSVEDLGAILTLFDDNVAWLVSQGREAQWGSEPFSADEKKTAFVRKLIEGGQTTLAIIGDEIVGALIISDEPMHYVPAIQEPEIYVHLLIASPTHRGAGIGSRLIQEARIITASRGVGLMRVDCWSGGDRRLVRYYESQGFTPTQEIAVRDTSVQVFEMRLAPS